MEAVAMRDRRVCGCIVVGCLRRRSLWEAEGLVGIQMGVLEGYSLTWKQTLAVHLHKDVMREQKVYRIICFVRKAAQCLFRDYALTSKSDGPKKRDASACDVCACTLFKPRKQKYIPVHEKYKEVSTDIPAPILHELINSHAAED